MIFLYHRIVSDSAPRERWYYGQALPFDAFKRQIGWLAKRFQLVSLVEYLLRTSNGRLRAQGIATVTFDDGISSTYRYVYPFLKEQRIPATFFIPVGHLEENDLCWFSYLDALCFEESYGVVEVNGRLFELRTHRGRRLARTRLGTMARQSHFPMKFSKELEKRYPLQEAVRAEYQGMTTEDLTVAGSDDLIELGSHTITHPYLSDISKSGQAREIVESKVVLTSYTRKPVRYFAYPGGDYNLDSIKLVREAGYEAAFATLSKKLGPDWRYEMDRVGIYSPSLSKVKLKSYGVASFGRRVGLRVG